MNNSKMNRSSKTPLWVMGGLLVVALAGLIYFASKASSHKYNIHSLDQQLTNLNVKKDSLNTDLEALHVSYDEQISNNEQLSIELEEKVNEVNGLKKKIVNAQALLNKSQNENKEIKERIAQMEELKIKLEEDIALLQESNQELVATNEVINTELEKSNAEVSKLNSQITIMQEKNIALAERLFKLAPAGFVADNFNVYAEKRNDKLTARANRTDEIKIAFDIRNVPERYQTEEEIYLVLTEFDGNPVPEIQSKKVTVKAKEPIKIEAAAIEKRALKDRQNIVMSLPTDKNLESGMYNVLVYADHGFLGSTSFQLQ